MAVFTRRLWLFLGTLAVTAFVLNWLWEMAQMKAYNEMASASWIATLAPCAFAALGDVVFTFLICGFVALILQERFWQTWEPLALAAIGGAMVATAYEWLSQYSGRWTYSDAMPIVPVLGVGLLPLLQLVLITPTAVWISASCVRTPDPGNQASH